MHDFSYFFNKPMRPVEKDSHEDYFLYNYQYLVSHFLPTKKLTKSDVIVGAYLVYGWMPTMLKTADFKGDSLIDLLNEIRDQGTITAKELQDLKPLTNNSIVGLSKLLHLLNPDKFPIWDSRIYKTLYNKNPYGYRVNVPKAYIEYLRIAEEGIIHPEFPQAHCHINNILGYDVSKVRALELILFRFQA